MVARPGCVLKICLREFFRFLYGKVTPDNQYIDTFKKYITMIVVK